MLILSPIGIIIKKVSIIESPTKTILGIAFWSPEAFFKKANVITILVKLVVIIINIGKKVRSVKNINSSMFLLINPSLLSEKMPNALTLHSISKTAKVTNIHNLQKAFFINNYLPSENVLFLLFIHSKTLLSSKCSITLIPL
ncbi:hypothetical protein MOUSESFB_1039 [Candidatus Arthromitus sp. SFB-mouse-Yit]|nr:hypothetical protein MOUSESFB_1039 [Candidatus Arthromitus sp. SFB-mouse-Yit]